MSEPFVRNIEQLVADEGIGPVSFRKRGRKDKVTQEYLCSFRRSEVCSTSAKRRRRRG
jgi:hypothetical protein